MLPSTGLFKSYLCPYFDGTAGTNAHNDIETGVISAATCHRPYCHFKHGRKESTEIATAVISARVPAPEYKATPKLLALPLPELALPTAIKKKTKNLEYQPEKPAINASPSKNRKSLDSVPVYIPAPTSQHHENNSPESGTLNLDDCNDELNELTGIIDNEELTEETHFCNEDSGDKEIKKEICSEESEVKEVESNKLNNNSESFDKKKIKQEDSSTSSHSHSRHKHHKSLKSKETETSKFKTEDEKRNNRDSKQREREKDDKQIHKSSSSKYKSSSCSSSSHKTSSRDKDKRESKSKEISSDKKRHASSNSSSSRNKSSSSSKKSTSSKYLSHPSPCLNKSSEESLTIKTENADLDTEDSLAVFATTEEDIMKECEMIYDQLELEYASLQKNSASSKNAKEDAEKAKDALKRKTLEEEDLLNAPSKKRVAYENADKHKSHMPATVHKPDHRKSAMQAIFNRQEAIKRKHEEDAAAAAVALKQAEEKVREANEALRKVKEKSLTPLVPKSYLTPPSKPMGRSMIAPVANMIALERAKKKVEELRAEKRPVFTPAQTSKAGSRLAHKISEKAAATEDIKQPKPPVLEANSTKISFNIRMQYYDLMVKHCLAIYPNTVDAWERVLISDVTNIRIREYLSIFGIRASVRQRFCKNMHKQCYLLK